MSILEDLRKGGLDRWSILSNEEKEKTWKHLKKEKKK